MNNQNGQDNIIKQDKINKTAKQNQKRLSAIRKKVKQIKSQCERDGIDPIRNLFAINYLGAFIVVASLIYIYIAGIISMFVPENHFGFLREIMRILECIVISIISYFFGGIFKKDKRINNEKKNGDF